MHLKRCFVSIIPHDNDGFGGKTILQGSVATRLRCGGIVSNHLTTNFLQNPSVKEFRKLVKIRQSYHEMFDAPFFKTQCSILYSLVFDLVPFFSSSCKFVRRHPHTQFYAKLNNLKGSSLVNVVPILQYWWNQEQCFEENPELPWFDVMAYCLAWT